MKSGYIMAIFLHLTLYETAATEANDVPETQRLVDFSSNVGQRFLWGCSMDAPFWNLAQFFAPQPDLASCSIASCTTVLNAMGIERPGSTKHGQYRIFTCDNFFTPDVNSIITRQRVAHSGMTLEEAARCLEAFKLEVRYTYASESNIGGFRTNLARCLNRDSFIIANYQRSALGQLAGGHISPIGAFNVKEDRVLIMDTATYKYPWVWVTTQDLWMAMATEIDKSSQRSRGYIVVAKTHE